MNNDWVIPLIILSTLALGGASWYFSLTKSKLRRNHGWVANSGYVKSLPSFLATTQRNRIFVGLTCLAAAGTILTNSVLAAGPIGMIPAPRPFNARDVLICLDSSDSMLADEADLLRTFAEVSKELNGERMGLSNWSEFLLVVFPMTNDYDMVQRRMAEISKMFDDGLISQHSDGEWLITRELWEFLGGTDNSHIGHGPTPDALAQCALSFNSEDENRTRAIFFLTANSTFLDISEPIYTLQQAAEMANDRGIQVNFIQAGDSTPEQIAELKDVAAANGGNYYEASDPDTLKAVADETISNKMIDVDALEPIETDMPHSWYNGLVVSLLLMLLLGIAIKF